MRSVSRMRSIYVQIVKPTFSHLSEYIWHLQDIEKWHQMLGPNTGREGGVSVVHTKPVNGECSYIFIKLAETGSKVLHSDHFTPGAHWSCSTVSPSKVRPRREPTNSSFSEWASPGHELIWQKMTHGLMIFIWNCLNMHPAGWNTGSHSGCTNSKKQHWLSFTAYASSAVKLSVKCLIQLAKCYTFFNIIRVIS
jgi:hypothetical protein